MSVPALAPWQQCALATALPLVGAGFTPTFTVLLITFQRFAFGVVPTADGIGNKVQGETERGGREAERPGLPLRAPGPVAAARWRWLGRWRLVYGLNIRKNKIRGDASSCARAVPTAPVCCDPPPCTATGPEPLAGGRRARGLATGCPLDARGSPGASLGSFRPISPNAAWPLAVSGWGVGGVRVV